MNNVIEIEPDNKTNSQLHFLPLGKTIRGRFDFNRDSEPLAKLHTAEFPEGVPGQRLGLNLDTGEAYIQETLHDERFKAVRQRIEKRGYGLGEQRETFPVKKEEYPTWLFWMKRAVEDGVCRVVKGTLPEKITGRIRKTFVSNEPSADPRDSIIDKLVALLVAKLPKEERRAVEEMLAKAE